MTRVLWMKYWVVWHFPQGSVFGCENTFCMWVPFTLKRTFSYFSVYSCLFLWSSGCLLPCDTAVPSVSPRHACHDESRSAATGSASTASSASAVGTSQTERAQTGGWEHHLVCVSLDPLACDLPVGSSQIRIRDPNQGGRDITEEIMSGGRTTSTPTPPQVCR